MIYLLVFGALFEKAALIPGFGGSSYLTFLTPGVVVMSALFSAAWNGMGVLEDLNRGTMDRFLVSPVRRGALIVGPIAQAAVVVIVQSFVIVGVGALRGAAYNGALGVAVLLVASVLLAATFASFSISIALTARKEETMIGAVQFVALPLTFLSSGFLPIGLAPSWIQAVARFNPVNWATEAGRVALAAEVDWTLVATRLLWLAALAAVMALLATGALRSYRRSA
jgi:ABC-2 type transport system permease protein